MQILYIYIKYKCKSKIRQGSACSGTTCSCLGTTGLGHLRREGKFPGASPALGCGGSQAEPFWVEPFCPCLQERPHEAAEGGGSWTACRWRGPLGASRFMLYHLGPQEG